MSNIYIYIYIHIHIHIIIHIYNILYIYIYTHTGIQDFPGHFGPHRLAESTPTEPSVKVAVTWGAIGWAVPVVPWPRCSCFGENKRTKGMVKLTIDQTGCSFRKFGDLAEICCFARKRHHKQHTWENLVIHRLASRLSSRTPG